jgi:hypothetical protein
MNASTAEVDRGSITEIGFSHVEVHYLLSVVDSDAARQSRVILGLDELPDPDSLSNIAASTLLARRLLTFTDDEQSIVPVDEAMYVSYVLVNATRWFTLQSTDGAALNDTGFLIESDLGRVLAQPRALDTWWFVLVDGAASSADLVPETAVSLLSQKDEMALFLHMQTADTDRSFTIHRKADGWSFAFGETGNPEPELRDEAAGLDECVAALREFVSNGD